MNLHVNLLVFVRGVMNLMKNFSHLMEVDKLLVRSCLYLMSIEELVECSTSIKPELLDMLYVFSEKAPHDITYSNFEVGGYTA